MAVEKILNKVLIYGHNVGFFETTSIGKIEKSCCDKSNIEAIDFDKTKEEHSRKFKFDTLQSCDALIIIPSKEHISFIEMKSLELFLKWQKPSKLEHIEQEVGKYDLEGKIRDSLCIFSNIINHKDSKLTGGERSVCHKTKKNYILLVDISLTENPLDFIAFSFSYLGMLSTDLKSILERKVNTIGEDTLNSLQRPMLMNCTTLEEYYNTL